MSSNPSFTNHNQGAQIGTFANQVQDNAQQSATNFTQNQGASPAELLALVANLRELTAEFPPAAREDIIIDIDDVETELTKPEGDRNPTRLKKRLMALLAAGTVIAGGVNGAAKFTNTVLDIGNKVGIELSLPTAP